MQLCVQLPDKRDINYVCAGCGGNLVVIKEENGRKTYNCDRCHKNECLECTICHKPRVIWADDGTICGGCGLKFLAGKLTLTEEQKAGVEKWIVMIQIQGAQ
jgi:DNA-directed RNA polymerase subunit RPC12/RpoP